jgi:hypothetical protein
MMAVVGTVSANGQMDKSFLLLFCKKEELP